MTSVATPGSGEPSASDEAGRDVLDDTLIRFRHLEQGRRDVLDASRIGVVMIDMERHVRYANRAALDMLGLSGYAGITLESIFRDESAQDVLRRQLRDRQAGFIGNYSVQAYRPDGRPVPLEITGLPIPDEHGVVVGSLGLFRNVEQQQLANRIHELNRRIGRADELLNQLAEALKNLFRFDRMSVARFSVDRDHVNGFFNYGQQNPIQKRWYYLTDDQMRWMMDPKAKVIPDIEQFLQDPVWQRFREDPAVKELLSAGIKSALRRDVRRANEVLGSVTLMSCEPNGFSEEQRRIFEELPIDAAVLQALSFEERQAMTSRLELVKALNDCTSVQDACSVLARKLVEHFGWSHVSILLCDHTGGRIHLLAQHWANDADPIRLPDRYEQAIDAGILGRVVSTRSAQNIPNVLVDHDFTPSVSSMDVRSELCVPVFAEDDKDVVRWIINVEDMRESAFAADECNALAEVASEVGGLIHRIGVLYVLTESFENASDPIFVTDAALRIRRANVAAARLLGLRDAKAVTGDLGSMFDDPQARVRLLGAPGDLGEFLIRRVGEPGESPTADEKMAAIPVFVSRQDVPQGLIGSVFIARDTRAMRRTLELELLEKAAYEVAVETSSPLALAVCELEHVARVMARVPNAPATGPGSIDELRRVNKVLRLLARVRHGYTKLAMFNPQARPKPSELNRLNLRAELEAMAADLASSERVRVTIEGDAPPAIRGDHFQIGTIFEALLSELLRYAPETQPVEAVLGAEAGRAFVRMRGFIAASTGGAEDDARRLSQTRADIAIARPLIDEFMQFHHGEFAEAKLPDQRTEFTLRFPAADAA